MPFAIKKYTTTKTEEQLRKDLLKNFDIGNYKDQLQLSLKREGGNRGIIRILFPKIKTYLKLDKGTAKCRMQLEWLGVIMLIVAIANLLIILFIPDEGLETIPLWGPIALSAWYLIYSFSSIRRNLKLLEETFKN
jgi:hypothetical protein